MTVRPDKKSRVTRVRSLEWTISARTGGPRSGETAPSPTGHLHSQPSPLLLNTHLKRNGAILVGPQQASLTASAQTTVSDIADALGITRRTVYRYFTSTEELFTAVVEVALSSFIGQVENITADMDMAGQLVEVVAYIDEQLPHSPQLVLLLANDRSNTFSRSTLAPAEVPRCRAILQTHPYRLGRIGLRRPHYRRSRRVSASHYPVNGLVCGRFSAPRKLVALFLGQRRERWRSLSCSHGSACGVTRNFSPVARLT